MKECTVIVPTTGKDKLFRAIRSVLSQTMESEILVVVDGKEHERKTKDTISEFLDRVSVTVLPHNTGGKGHNGHRIYASFPHLVNTKYLLFLDEDCWFDENHIESLVKRIEEDNLSWAYSLRKMFREEEFFCNDDCESLGKWRPFTPYEFVDTNCYCIPTQNAIQCCHTFHGHWLQDRVFFKSMKTRFPNYGCTGLYTTNYSLEPRDYFQNPYEFFEVGNKVSLERFPDAPWRAK